MPYATVKDLQPGRRVRVEQVIERRAGDWRAQVEGVIEQVDVGTTGSWYAHGKDDKLWLRRVRLRKADGEVSILNLDQYSRVELLD